MSLIDGKNSDDVISFEKFGKTNCNYKRWKRKPSNQNGEVAEFGIKNLNIVDLTGAGDLFGQVFYMDTLIIEH